MSALDKVTSKSRPESVSSLPPTPVETTKINLIRDRVLQLIRSFMPIPTLFTPELKIDLSVFIKDQVLFHRIAEFIEPLGKTGEIDINAVKEHFKEGLLLSEIETMITTMFIGDLSPYLTTFYQACTDALNNAPFSSKLQVAIEGRIFTLKNALFAVHAPAAIRKSQVQFIQDVPNIQEEGALFIRESLGIHLTSLRASAESRSFQETLTATAEQLLPFVKKITRSYLSEYRLRCPENPLVFRDPTGHNHHGFVAATVLEVCLNALGYRTELMLQDDLNPKVTLATSHSVVMVVASDQKRYMVDPTYLQFHKDTCLDETRIPTSPILVLEESAIDGYIEQNIMVEWKATFRLVSANDARTIEKLKQNDRLLSFVTHKLKLAKELIPEDPEGWARTSFQKVWRLSSRYPIFSDQALQEIFYGSEEIHSTYDSIKSMNLPSLTYHLSDEEVEKRLNPLLKNPALKGKNSPDAMALIGQLPALKRQRYAPLLDFDPRLQTKAGLDVGLNAYFRALKKIVNPEGKDLTAVYGCSGADCTSILLATDASDLTFVDLTPTTFSEFQNALAFLKPQSGPVEAMIMAKFAQENFLSFRYRYGGAISIPNPKDGTPYMSDLPLKLLFDLRETGVNLNQVSLTSCPEGVHIDFPWQYYGANQSRKRRITFITADITNPAAYPAFLKAKIEQGLDIFYLKGALFAPKRYPQFLPHIAKSIRSDGWLMTSDKTMIMDLYHPEPCLESHGLTFTLRGTEETRMCQDLMRPPFNPLADVPVLDINPDKRRESRTPGSDLTYWSILNLRQKTSEKK